MMKKSFFRARMYVTMNVRGLILLIRGGGVFEATFFYSLLKFQGPKTYHF